ncbi:uncharacterized protein [Dysidea avara]|uniref:uncharacterized protein isoform X2 n=1 Tax=Dysidea avara TaxID=196820 RepID=UPI00332412CB
MLNTAEQASVEFGVLLNEILKELKKNENDNLELLKTVSSVLTVKDNSDVKMFNDSEVEGIYACNNISILLMIKLRHCYRWDDHSMLTVLMSSLNSKKCLKLLQLFETKVYSKIKLQQIQEHCLEESSKFPEGYHKMVAIIDNKIFSSITKEEYDELKQFISQYCGVDPYVMSPFSKASPFSSVVFEWFIPVSAATYMIEAAYSNVQNFKNGLFIVYLKISSTVIFDHRNNKSECNQLLEAAKTDDVITVERLINTRYIDVNTTDGFNQTALHQAASNGHVQLVEALIALGANVNSLDMLKWTALHDAANSGHVQTAKTLIKLGADVNAIDIDSDNPLQIALQGGHRHVVEFMVKEAKVNTTQLNKTTRSKIKKMLEQSANLKGQKSSSSPSSRWYHASIGRDELSLDEWSSLTSLYSSTVEGGQDEQNKILQLSSELSEIQTHTTRESPIPSTKQSSTISDHTSTIGGSGVSSHGLEMKQKEQEHFIKSSDDDDDADT